MEAKLYGKPDPRLMVNAVSTFGGEAVGADGGYLLPPQWANEVNQAVMPADSFLSAMNVTQTNSNLLSVPVDEVTPWGTTGITGAVTAEGGAITASKPLFRKLNVVLQTIKALVHVSNESLSDIPFLASYVQRNISEKLRWNVENLVVNGDGQNSVVGFLNAPGLLSLSDSASTATVIGAADVYAMYAAKLPGRAFWVVSPTVLPSIWSMKSDATAGYPLFAPDVKAAPGFTLAGLPVYVSEACPAINTAGDILLVQPDGYIMATQGGVSSSSTIGFAFDQDLMSFKATYRLGGAPVLSAKVTRANASTYASHLVTLAGSRS